MKKRASYGRIKETTIGGFVMPRSYRHIKQYEKELMELKEKGMTVKEIGEKFGLTYDQTHDFFKRQNRKKKKIEAGQAIRKKGRPPKDYVVTEDMKIQELKYIIARKDSKIKSLEMEIKLMQDFLSLTERK